MSKKTFIEVPLYADNPDEYERALCHNASILTKPQLIKMVVGLAIESEQNRRDSQEAKIDEHDATSTIIWMQKYVKGLRPKGQHIDGGNTTQAKKEAHKKHIEVAVAEHLAWTDSRICNYLVKQGMNNHKGHIVKPRMLKTYIAEIKAEHTPPQPTI